MPDQGWERDRRQGDTAVSGQTGGARRKRSRSPDQAGDRGDDHDRDHPSQKRARGWEPHQPSVPRGNAPYAGDRRSSSPSRVGRNQTNSDSRGSDRRPERRGGSSRY